MATASKLPSGSWRVRVYVGKDKSGKNIYESFTADTKRQAEFEAAQYLADLKRRKKAVPTLYEAFDKYIESRPNSTSPSTIRGYRIIQKNALGDLADVPVDEIDKQTLQRHFDAAVKKYAHKSRVNQYGLISSVLAFSGHPAPAVNLGRSVKSEILVPTKSDCEKLMQLLIGSPIELQALLALTCSLTQSEIGALTPNHVKGNRLFVRGARIPDEHNNYVISEYNKNATRSRSVIMPDYLAGRMAELCAQAPSKDALLFPQYACGVLAALKRLCRNNNMPEYTMHSLRHAFAAWMHNEGVKDAYIMKAGGWATPNVMQRVYRYAFEDEADSVKAEVNKTFSLPSYATKYDTTEK